MMRKIAYLDLDGKVMPPGVNNADELCERAERMITEIFRDEYNVELKATDFVWLQSPRQTGKELSVHLVISTHEPHQHVYHGNHQDDPQGAMHLAMRLKQLDPECVGAVVDTAVYTKDREMRMCGSSTADSSQSVLEPMSGRHQPLLWTDTVITCLDAKRQELYVPVHIPRIVREERRPLKKPSEATSLADEVMPADVAATRMLELLRARLHATAYHDKTHGEEDAYDPMRGVKFSHEDRSEPCYTGNVHEGTQNLRCYVDVVTNEVYAKCFSTRCAQAAAHRLGRFEPPNDEHLSQAAFVDMAYLERNKDATFDALVAAWQCGEKKTDVPTTCAPPKGLALRSPMGTGKSTFLDAMLSEPEFAKASVLVVTYRQTLALEQERKLQNHRFVNYMSNTADLADRKVCDRVICQVESLHRLTIHRGVPPKPFHTVIIDESESVLRHFASPTVRTPGETMALLSFLLRRAKRVLTMDAFWGAATHEFLAKVEVPNQLIVNQRRGPSRTFAFTNMQAAWLEIPRR